MDAKQIKNTPTIMVVFGATGDLMRRKIIPAFFHLFDEDRLPEHFVVIGVSRRDIPTEEWRASVKETVAEHLGREHPRVDEFAQLFQYQSSRFEDPQTYSEVAQRIAAVDGDWKICADKIFYLAVPPDYYRGILEYLAGSGLTDACGGPQGWTRVMVEKPFGKNIDEARELDNLLGSLFKEEQVYRIDHYLAKEVLQNIVLFRFANNLLEDVWSQKYIDRVDVRLIESLGVEGRGSFYDGVGALLDVGQNHLLQMLALVTMDYPGSLDADVVRQARLSILEGLTGPQGEAVGRETIRGQYKDFRGEPGVSDDSDTETYFKVRAHLDSPRWRGVPFFLEGGKALDQPRKEVVVSFRHPTPCLCPPGDHYRNSIKFRLEPEPGISIKFWSKKPGERLGLEERNLDFKYGEEAAGHGYLEEYPKLVLDCIAGDQTLFISGPETIAGWRFIDPIISGWRKNITPLHLYAGDDILSVAGEEWETASGGQDMEKRIGVVGLGKMGGGIAGQLLEKGWEVVGFNRNPKVTQQFEQEGLEGAASLAELVGKLQPPRVVWVMVPAGKPVDDIILGDGGLSSLLEPGDIVIDGGNSFYKDSARRGEELAPDGIKFMDCGVSGGPSGARQGASLMIGGDRQPYEQLQPLFRAIAAPAGEQFFEGIGAGHFVKMVHNGIEYGMMQAIAEGFAIMKESQYDLDLTRVADVYNHDSVIESRLVGWLKSAYESFGEDLQSLSGSVAHTGEAESTIDTARELGVPDSVIEAALRFRVASEDDPSYAGQILTALRGQFGGHAIRSNDGE